MNLESRFDESKGTSFEPNLHFLGFKLFRTLGFFHEIFTGFRFGAGLVEDLVPGQSKVKVQVDELE